MNEVQLHWKNNLTSQNDGQNTDFFGEKKIIAILDKNTGFLAAYQP